QPASGNQTLSAQVVTQAGSPKTAQEGVMMRANASPTAPYYSVLLNPGGSATIQWRGFEGGAPPAGKRQTPPQPFFSALTSADGTNWPPVLGSTVAIDMGTNYLAGLAATANAPPGAPPVSYNAVTLTASAAQPPGICPSGFACSDVGTDILPGNQVYIGPQQGG